MRLSDIISERIMKMIEDSQNGIAEIGRNELAALLGCVPSQINYVLASRFTPEQGYIVESRRGGGGFIRITRVSVDRSSAIMHLINSIGERLDSSTARILVSNLLYQNLISTEAAVLINIAVSDKCYRDIDPNLRDTVRATVLKQLLLSII
ncbi:MAG: CtsR family transcriptional regulator [Clostridiales bacterium 43-6]|nr:MAG: CtsR family transcriptional regulator [Clostridiales bacterium 43-6]